MRAHGDVYTLEHLDLRCPAVLIVLPCVAVHHKLDLGHDGRQPPDIFERRIAEQNKLGRRNSHKIAPKF